MIIQIERNALHPTYNKNNPNTIESINFFISLFMEKGGLLVSDIEMESE